MQAILEGSVFLASLEGYIKGSKSRCTHGNTPRLQAAFAGLPADSAEGLGLQLWRETRMQGRVLLIMHHRLWHSGTVGRGPLGKAVSSTSPRGWHSPGTSASRLSHPKYSKPRERGLHRGRLRKSAKMVSFAFSASLHMDHFASNLVICQVRPFS